jgi:hypothetical protein
MKSSWQSENEIGMKHIPNFLLPKLRVHTWGGFGSQLFTAYLILRLKHRYPGRRIMAVIHTSGVSRRVTELNFEAMGIRATQNEDFFAGSESDRELGKVTEHKTKFVTYLKNLAVKKLQRIRLVVDANNENSYALIKPWTLALRGHYTNLRLEKEIIKELYDLVLIPPSRKTHSSPRVVVHYRLGDLLSLQQKSPVESKRVDLILSSINYSNVVPTLLTDSPSSEFLKFISGTKSLENSRPETLDPLNTLRLCVEAEILIGTGAKISLWAAIFRQFEFRRTTYLPKELRWAENKGLDVFWY